MTNQFKHQVMMFSATMDEAMRGLCKKFMADPHEISVDKDSKLTLTGLIQYHNVLTDSEKNRKLNDLLDELEFNQVVIFCEVAGPRQGPRQGLAAVQLPIDVHPLVDAAETQN